MTAAQFGIRSMHTDLPAVVLLVRADSPRSDFPGVSWRPGDFFAFLLDVLRLSFGAPFSSVTTLLSRQTPHVFAQLLFMSGALQAV
eukprot:scaffold172844_cov31-Tisochrysis_lutea.AAC.2